MNRRNFIRTVGLGVPAVTLVKDSKPDIAEHWVGPLDNKHDDIIGQLRYFKPLPVDFVEEVPGVYSPPDYSSGPWKIAVAACAKAICDAVDLEMLEDVLPDIILKN